MSLEEIFFTVLIVRYVKGVYSHSNENIVTFIIVLKSPSTELLFMFHSQSSASLNKVSLKGDVEAVF